jgi:hypothetical protein
MVVGSSGAVGSCVFNSVVRSVRNMDCVSLSELAEELAVAGVVGVVGVVAAMLTGETFMMIFLLDQHIQL